MNDVKGVVPHLRFILRHRVSDFRYAQPRKIRIYDHPVTDCDAAACTWYPLLSISYCHGDCNDCLLSLYLSFKDADLGLKLETLFRKMPLRFVI